MTGSTKPVRGGSSSAQLRESAHQAVTATKATVPDTPMASALRLLFPECYSEGRSFADTEAATGDATPRSVLEARKLVARLSWSLRTERRLGRAGHWAYDINRHIALAQNLRGAQAALATHPPEPLTGSRPELR